MSKARDRLADLARSDSRRSRPKTGRKAPPPPPEPVERRLSSVAVPPQLLARLRTMAVERSNAEGRRVPPYELIMEALDAVHGKR